MENINENNLAQFKTKLESLKVILNPDAEENKLIKPFLSNINLKKPWFSLYNPKLHNIDELFKYMDMQPYYEGFYRNLSKRVHSSNVISERILHHDENMVSYPDVRFPFRLTSYVKLNFTFMNRLIQDFCNSHNKKYFPTYQLWYLEQFSADFQKMDLINLHHIINLYIYFF